jgi:hypothetical protein
VNRSDYTFRDKEFREYTSNNPLAPSDDAPAFEKHRLLSYGAGFLVRFRQQYISRPYRKVLLGTEYPVLRLRYYGAAGLQGDGLRKHLFEAGLSDEFGLGLAGSLEWQAWYGRFVGSHNLYLQDFKHFPGNLTVFSSFTLRKYYILDYYAYSTAREYAEGHAEYNLNGFLLNKLPWLRKLRLQEIAGFHFLHVPGLPEHYEVSFGLSKFDLIRVEVAASFSGTRHETTALRIAVVGLQ